MAGWAGAMWKPRSIESPLGMARPWTPPDTDTDADDPAARHDYFSDPYRTSHGQRSPGAEFRSGSAKEEVFTGVGARCDTPTDDNCHRHLRPRPKSTATAPATPYTPTKSPQIQHSLSYGDAQAQGLPRYPYTPDSTRIPRRTTERALSPIPWDTYSPESSSPVQNALSSCLAHFENLLQTRQPDEDQMEYIVGQFEAMASYLSAPDAQSRNDHLFNDLENGLGITKTSEAAIDQPKPAKEMNEEYIAEVGRYIESVRGHVSALKMRLDEVKMLNSIQLDVIQDLRNQMQSVKQGMQTTLQAAPEPASLSDQDESQYPSSNPSTREFGLDSTATLVNPSSLPNSQILSPLLLAKIPSIPTPRAVSPAPSPSPPKTQSQTRSKPSTPKKEKENHTKRHISFDPTLPSHYPSRKIITVVHEPPKRSFWASFAEALDRFGEVIWEQ
ncbi:hypothetical protein NX059_008664 [Plenodomus lindquistii]|nr:hypothetical protein NX059_008664 [Plenodomus lindquistii]